MRILLGLLLLLGTAAAQPRLSDDVMPERHALTLEPDLQSGSFRGEAAIQVRVRAPRSAITLNALGLTVERASIDAQPARVTTGDETVTLTVDKPVSGAATVRLVWRGRLNESLSGFYLARDGEARYAVTD